MPIDPFDPGTSVAQHFPTQEPDTFRRLAQIIAAQKREMFDIRASVLANVSDIVADLRGAVDAVAAQQADLAAQLVSINALVGAQITGAGDNTYWSGTFTTAYASYAPVTIPVPAGFSIAQVTGISSVSTGAPAAEIKTRIAGVDSSPITLLSGPGTISYVRTLTGLSGGSITVESRVSVYSSATGIANTSVGVLFFR